MSSSLLPLQPFMQQRTTSDPQSKASVSSSGTVQRPNSRGRSRSVRSRGSTASNRLCVRNENVPSSRDSSNCSLPITPTPFAISQGRDSTFRRRKSSWTIEAPLVSCPQAVIRSLSDVGPLENIDLNSPHQTVDLGFTQDHGSSSDIKDTETASTPSHMRGTSHETGPARKFNVITDHPFSNGKPFKKWVGSLRQRRHLRKRTLTAREERWTLDDLDDEGKPAKASALQRVGQSKHQNTSSGSRSGFRAAEKSNTANETPFHGNFSPRRTRRSYILRSNRGSGISNPRYDTHTVEDQRSTSASEQAACDRAKQRRRILEEIMSTEESYVADLKVLLHVYVFILDSAPKVAQAAQPNVSRNVGEMLRLHEEILVDIKRLMAGVEERSANDTTAQTRLKHGRWRSIDTIESVMGEKATSAIRRSLDLPWLGRFRHQTSVTVSREVAAVAKVFERMLPRFFIYEEYGAKYESMLQNMASLSRTMPTWPAYERGIESLMNSLVPHDGGTSGSKKGLTLADLLIKPIQRVCRYPLLFAELYRHTPVTDDPEVRMEVEKTYRRLRETANGINKAANDPQTQLRIQRSWRLQDLLVFPQTCATPFPLRQLGHASLCGVLYVAYQSKDEVLGNYMFCALIGSHLLLAVLSAGNSPFEIVAVIRLNDVQMDRADNGRGLQCHTAPFSWKLMFESDQQLYELMFCACTTREEQQWKADLLDHAAKKTESENVTLSQTNLLGFENSFLWLHIKPLGPVFGLPGTLMRRQSIQRAVTVNSRKNASQVIIKNTYSLKDNGDSPVRRAGTLSRSKSLMSTNQVPLLAPRRGDRQRIEQKMSEVWTKDRLPYPGMTGHRGGHLIRTSANSVMRKLSMASTNTTVSFTGSVKQHDVTYGSIAESNPFTEYTAGSRLNQTDGASSLLSENACLYPETFWSTFEFNETRAISQPAMSTPKDGEITYVTKIKIDPVSSGGGMSREVSDTSTILAMQNPNDSSELSAASGRSKRLPKAFSAEGIRSWFHH